MALTLRYAAASDVGLLREENEDSAYAGPRLLAVADGMGGAAAGEVASSVAIARLADLDDDAPGADLLDLLQRTVEVANAELHDMVEENSEFEGMGTTLTALLWEGGGRGGRLGLAHVGDSRAYLWRGDTLSRITRDHTLVQSLVDEGRLSSEEATTHPQRSLLTNVLDGRATPELDLSLREARAGDRYLLCSDGLPAVVSEETIAEELRGSEPQQAVERLIELALRGGGPDNVTCVVADVVEGEPTDTGPVVVGAAATRTPKQQRMPAETAAGRAALARRGADDDSPAPAPTAARRQRRRVRRPLAITFAVLSLLALAAAGGWAYLQTQYYVGEEDGRVVVFRGVSGSVAGFSLHSVEAETGLEVADLPVEQAQLEDGIRASSRDDADEIVGRLREQVCPSPEPTPQRTTRRGDAERSRPSPTPSPTADPSDGTPDCTEAAP